MSIVSIIDAASRRLLEAALLIVAAAVFASCLSGCQGQDAAAEQGGKGGEPLEAVEDGRAVETVEIAIDVDYSELASAVEDIVERYSTSYSSIAVTFEAVGDKVGGFSINGDVPLISASTIKLAVLAALFDEVEKGNVDLSQTLVSSSEDVVAGTGIGIGYGEEHEVGDLAFYMIAYSDNTASNMLITLIGMDKVNSYAQELGLVNTYLDHKFMKRPIDRSNETSTNDLAALLTMIAEDGLFGEELDGLAKRHLLAQEDTDGLASGLSGGFLLGNKTGSAPTARNDAGVVFASNGDPVAVIAVMTNDLGEDRANRMMREIMGAVCDRLTADGENVDDGRELSEFAQR